MKETKKYTLAGHKDIELAKERKELELYVTEPEAGINEETGLLIVLDDFEGFANSYYQDTEVRPHLANRHNLLVAGVNYFGISRQGSMEIRQGFLHNLNRIYGLGITASEFGKMVSNDQVIADLATRLAKKGVINMDLRCQPIVCDGKGEYQSWGLLPAIDALTAVGYLLRNYPEIDQKKVFIMGSGYGGYIASLAAKFAPNTFAAVIDRDSYVKSEMKIVAAGEMLDPSIVLSIPFSDFPIPFQYGVMLETPWTIEDETSASYFSDSHRKIRSLLQEDHFVETETKFYLYQSTEDILANSAERRRYAEILGKKAEVHWEENEGKKLGVNLQDLFNRAMEKEQGSIKKQDEDNEFSKNMKNTFACGDKSYTFSFKDDYTMKVSVKEKRKATALNSKGSE